MRKLLLFGVAALAIAAISSGRAAMAADLVPVDEGVDWSGFYIGGHLGYGEADISARPHEGETGDGNGDVEPNGIVGGMHAGFNWQMDSFLIGVEGDLSATGWSENTEFSDNSSRTFDADVDWLASLRARLGLALDPALLYVTGGIAFSDGSFLQISPDGTAVTGDYNAFGGVVGAGGELMLRPNFSIRAEGLWYFFDETEKDFGTHDGAETNYDDAWVIRAGATYHFNGQ